MYDGYWISMIALVEQHLESIRDLCREFGVLRLDLFGSAATGDFDPERSDIDFLVEYPPDYDFGHWLTRYFALKERLEVLLGHPVDLIMSGAPRNPYVISSIEETCVMMYPVDPDRAMPHAHDPRRWRGIQASKAIHRLQQGATLQPDSTALIRALRDGHERRD